MEKNFFQLDMDELLRMVPVIRDNSKRLSHSARLVGDAGDYGTAASLLILAAEEQLKAFLVLLEGRGFSFRKSKVLKNLFTQHKPRHAVLREAFSVWVLCSELLAEGPLPSGKSRNPLSRLVDGFGRGFLTQRWWDKADDLKQQGFYADYRDGIWDPSAITKEQYEQAIRHTTRLQDQSDLWMDKVSKMDDAELKRWKTIFEDADLAELLTESIGRHRN